MHKHSLSTNKGIRIFIDTTPLKSGHAVRGIGTYTRNLELELKRRGGVKVVDQEKDADVVHYPYFDLFFNTLHPIKDKPIVVTIYDVIPLIYPKQYPPGIKGKLNFLRQKRELSKIAAIITISETSKKDIVRFLDVPPDKVYSIYLAPSPGFKKLEIGKWKLEITKRYSLPERFVLYVGDVNYNKNLLVLAAACKKIDTPLVVVGKQAVEENVDWSHPENKQFGEFIEEYGSDSLIRRVGFVPEEDLVKIYNLATVYCQPSLYEGFGLPVLEAMACGTPVVAAKTQALVETAEGVSVFVNPKVTSDIASGLAIVLEDPELQRELSRKGLEHVKRFSWTKAADETIQVYQKVVK
ncbi:MAG: glycosyltransferase family 1 protein [bacterium]|nr:glycosyltransferase family 1 protein [bacterium]